MKPILGHRSGGDRTEAGYARRTIHHPPPPRAAPNATHRAIAAALVRWFAAAQRELPWRRSRDPYRVWVSEIMLQQTTVAAVIPYFERWMKELPSLEALACAPTDRVMRLFEGLGYYSRVRRLHEAARLVVRDRGGAIPSSVSELRRLPGIGRYTAGAIASIAFGLPEPILDTNAARVLSRLFAVEGLLPQPAVQRVLWSHAAQLVQLAPPAEVNQGLMDLGASLCTLKRPRCGECPLHSRCKANTSHRVADFPQVPKRPAAKTAHVVVAIIEHRASFLLLPRAATDAPWPGLFVFPFAPLATDESPELLARNVAARYVATHNLCVDPTHQVLRYTIARTQYSARIVRLIAKTRLRLPPDGARWIRGSGLSQLALPAPHRRLAQALHPPDSSKTRRMRH